MTRLTVRLETPKGEFVSFCHLMPFAVLPEVVAWGERVFIHSGARRDNIPVYLEGLLVYPIDEQGMPVYYPQYVGPGNPDSGNSPS